jgi:hypothetical protein
LTNITLQGKGATVKDDHKFEVFTTQDDEGNDVMLRISLPSSRVRTLEGQRIYNKAWNQAINSGARARASIETILREQGLWDEDKEKQMQDIQEKIMFKGQKLDAGGMTKDEGYQLAMEILDLRRELQQLIGKRLELDNHTAEAQAENMRFNYFVSACAVYEGENGKKYFKDLDDYLERSESKAAQDAASKLFALYYGSDPEQNKKLPEFRFLNRFGYVNELFQFLNQDGKPYDRDTNLLINEKGHFINENGERIDKYGNLLDEQGEVIQVHPFE